MSAKQSLQEINQLMLQIGGDGLQVVLVGHSMAGLANVMLMERFPHKIDLAVFVAALVVPSGIAFSHAMPLRGRVMHASSHSPTASNSPKQLSIMNALWKFCVLYLQMHKDADLRYQNGPENPPTSALFPKCKLQSIMYNGIDPEVSLLNNYIVVCLFMSDCSLATDLHKCEDLCVFTHTFYKLDIEACVGKGSIG